MARNSEFVEFVSDQLAPLGGVESRPMFGGHGLYVDGQFCAIVWRDTLYLKADEMSRGEFEAIGALPFQPYPDRPMTLRYYAIGADILDDRERLLEWARKAIAAARRDPPKAPRRR